MQSPQRHARLKPKVSTGVVGADISARARRITHSAAGDSVSSEKPGDTGPAVLAAATSLALRTSQAEETQAK